MFFIADTRFWIEGLGQGQKEKHGKTGSLETLKLN